MNLVNTTIDNNYRAGGVDNTNSIRGFDSLYTIYQIKQQQGGYSNEIFRRY